MGNSKVQVLGTGCAQFMGENRSELCVSDKRTLYGNYDFTIEN